jgi:hypothetical protein
VETSLALKNQINSETSCVAELVFFWDQHAAVVIEDRVLDPTARQFDQSITGLLHLSKKEYIYGLAGGLFQKGKVVLVNTWDTLKTNKQIKIAK